MKPPTILRTAAGALASPSQYREFQRLGCRVVAVDSDPLSVGFRFADAYRVVPRVDDPGYVAALLDVCCRERVDAILPNLDEELVLLNAHYNAFWAIGARVLVADRCLWCVDKWATYTFLRRIGVPVPKTYFAGSVYAPCVLPAVVKPRRGRGSRGVYVAHTAAEVEFFARYVTDPVVQPQCQGTEYTVDVLAGWNGEPLIVSPRKRLAAQGVSTKGCTAEHDEIRRHVEHICRSLPLVGPACVQCFVEPDGRVLFTEVNARLAGTAVLSQAAGVPLFEGIISMCRGETPPKWTGRAREVTMLRYWAEHYTEAGA